MLSVGFAIGGKIGGKKQALTHDFHRIHYAKFLQRGSLCYHSGNVPRVRPRVRMWSGVNSGSTIRCKCNECCARVGLTWITSLDRRPLRRSKVRCQRVCRCTLASHWRYLARHGRARLLAYRDEEPTGFLNHQSNRRIYFAIFAINFSYNTPRGRAPRSNRRPRNSPGLASLEFQLYQGLLHLYIIFSSSQKSKMAICCFETAFHPVFAEEVSNCVTHRAYFFDLLSTASSTNISDL
jgi:hypothetical protein